MEYEITRQGFVGARAIRYSCPSCREPLQSELAEAGKRDSCPKCGKGFVVPGKEEADLLIEEDQHLRHTREAAKKAKQEKKQQQLILKKARQAEKEKVKLDRAIANQPPKIQPVEEGAQSENERSKTANRNARQLLFFLLFCVLVGLVFPRAGLGLGAFGLVCFLIAEVINSVNSWRERRSIPNWLSIAFAVLLVPVAFFGSASLYSKMLEQEPEKTALPVGEEISGWILRKCYVRRGEAGDVVGFLDKPASVCVLSDGADEWLRLVIGPVHLMADWQGYKWGEEQWLDWDSPDWDEPGLFIERENFTTQSPFPISLDNQ